MGSKNHLRSLPPQDSRQRDLCATGGSCPSLLLFYLGAGGKAKVPVSPWDRRGARATLMSGAQCGGRGLPPMSREEEENKKFTEEVVTSVGLEQTTWASVLLLHLQAV